MNPILSNAGKTVWIALVIFLCLRFRPAMGQLADRASERPSINGATIYGARPNHPFLYRVPATGKRPMQFSASGLPPGLTLDSTTGTITGTVTSPGSSNVVLQASNTAGTSIRKFRIVIGDQLALTPPMGWSSWDLLQSEASDRDIRAQADAMVSSGLIDHGYSYLNIDDGWAIKLAGSSGISRPRDTQGNIRPNERFPDMKALTTYIHSKGMKAGIYSSPGPLTCGKFAGSYGHEQQDARQFATWGFDLLKYDWCSYEAKDNSLPELQKPYRLMSSILVKGNRDVLFSLCQYGRGDVSAWGRQVGGQLWRTTGDLAWGPKGLYSSWDNIAADFEQRDHAKWVGPGGWNDLDDLLVGHIAYIPFNEKPPNVKIDRIMPPPLTPDEQYAQVSLWSLLSAPLIIGGDLTTLDAFSLSLLTNDEVIAIDQDPLGRQATEVIRQGKLSVWVKDLEGNSKAVGLFNLGDSEQEVGATWANLGVSGRHLVRDLWRQKDLGSSDREIHALVAPHGVVLVRISAGEK